MAGKKENRRASRSKHDSVLEIYDAKGLFVAAIGRLVNVSSVGASFFTTSVLPKSKRIRVRLRLLKEGVIDASAHVVWSRNKPNATLYGIEFDTVQRHPRP